MHKLTHQEIFTKAVLGVVQQGALSVGRRGGCFYRSRRNGQTLACGVGHLIEDDLYSRGMEGAAVEAASPFAPANPWASKQDCCEKLMLALLFSGVDVTDRDTSDLLGRIQSAHDGSSTVADFVVAVRRVADDEGLKFPRLPA
jgi:hypothetical protein